MAAFPVSLTGKAAFQAAGVAALVAAIRESELLPLVGRGVPASRPPFPEATSDFCMHFVTNFLQFTGFRKSDGCGKILGSGQIGKE